MPKPQKKSSEERLQTKYIQYQMLRQQLSAFAEEKQAVDQRMAELNSTIDALHKLEETNKGDEIWSPLGGGTFVRSDIKDTEKVLVAIGAGVVAKETRERAIEILQERMEHLTKLNGDILAEAGKISKALEKLEPEIEKLAGEQHGHDH